MRTRTHHPWTLPPPVGLAVWPRLVGHIQGRHPDRHETLMDHPVPHIVLGGAGRIRSVHGEWSLRAGDVFCLWPGLMYDYQCEAGASWEFCWLHLHDAAGPAFVGAMGFSSTVCYRRPAKPAATVALGRRLLRAYAEPGRAGVPSVARDLQQLVLLTAPAHPETPPPDLVTDALGLLRSLMHTGLNVNDIAHNLGCDRTTLQRAFRRHLGESPIATLNRLRLDRAVQLLRTTDHTVDTIAHLVGYSSGKYLSRRCARDLGSTPSEIRAAAHR